MALALVEGRQAILSETAMPELMWSLSESRLPAFPPGTAVLAPTPAPAGR